MSAVQGFPKLMRHQPAIVIHAAFNCFEGFGASQIRQRNGADDGIRTRDTWLGKPLPYHWATSARQKIL